MLLSLGKGGAFRQDENKPFISVTLTPRDKTNEEAVGSTVISPGSYLIASLSPGLASRPHPSIPDTLQAKEPIALAETGNNEGHKLCKAHLEGTWGSPSTAEIRNTYKGCLLRAENKQQNVNKSYLGLIHPSPGPEKYSQTQEQSYSAGHFLSALRGGY